MSVIKLAKRDRILPEHGANRNMLKESSPKTRAFVEVRRANQMEVAKLLHDNGSNPNVGDSCKRCLTIAEIYHGKMAKPLQE